MSPAVEHRTLAALTTGLALLSLTVGFGAVDLASPWILHEGTQASDVGYGTLAGLMIPIGLLAQTFRRSRSLGGVGQVALAAAAYLIAGALTGQKPLLLAGTVVGLATAGVVMLHPDQVQLVCRTRRPSLPMLLLAVLACGPGLQYVLHMAFNARNGVLPADAHLGLGHWAALSAAALAALFAAVLASFRPAGFAIPAFTAVAAVLAWAVTCLVYPDSAGVVGREWAGLAIIWALAFGAIASIEVKRSHVAVT